MKPFTIAYVTCRKTPKIEWFFASLAYEAQGNYDDIRIIVVDFYAQTHLAWTQQEVDSRKVLFRYWCQCPNYLHIPPKPTPWAGPHRLTKHDYFAAANTRNTAIAHCPDAYIAFVDDLSVLMPGWLKAAREAVENNRVVCGAFRKVKNIVFGTKLMFDDYPAGHDPRWKSGDSDKAVPCAPQWFFGCSLVSPIEAFLVANGYPESADGMGYEDCVTGEIIARHGYPFFYDRRLLTYEDEVWHHVDKPMLRIDKGTSPNDKSHALLKMLAGAKESGNRYSLREMRNNVLNNLPFTMPVRETVDWFDGQPLSEM